MSDSLNRLIQRAAIKTNPLRPKRCKDVVLSWSHVSSINVSALLNELDFAYEFVEPNSHQLYLHECWGFPMSAFSTFLKKWYSSLSFKDKHMRKEYTGATKSRTNRPLWGKLLIFFFFLRLRRLLNMHFKKERKKKSLK